MRLKTRRRLNISLIILSAILGGMAAWLYRLPPLVLSPEANEASDIATVQSSVTDTVITSSIPEGTDIADTVAGRSEPVIAESEKPARQIPTATRFRDAEPRTMTTTADHPFRAEALKVLNGHLEESDSLSRHKILSYCEHLRTSYTTRDIDFIRQVFSDDALIIVGHVVRQGDDSSQGLGYNDRVRYSIRSKHEYIGRLSRLFDSGRKIDVRFSDFRIMRHPTMRGIYGVTLRQKYSCGDYSDDGYLFLLWDFRNPSMPLIHVRTWQPALSLTGGEDDIIDIGDFNLE